MSIELKIKKVEWHPNEEPRNHLIEFDERTGLFIVDTIVYQDRIYDYDKLPLFAPTDREPDYLTINPDLLVRNSQIINFRVQGDGYGVINKDIDGEGRSCIEWDKRFKDTNAVHQFLFFSRKYPQIEFVERVSHAHEWIPYRLR